MSFQKTIFVLFMAIFLMGTVACSDQEMTESQVTTEVTSKDCDFEKPLIISHTDLDKLIATYFTLKHRVEMCGEATAYVHGLGGSGVDAQGFFDLMRSDVIYKQVTFIAVGSTWSASNRIWLAAAHRVVTPAHLYILHGTKWNMDDEDPETRLWFKQAFLEKSMDAIEYATGEEATQMWYEAVTNKREGFVLTAQEAVRIGWATEIREYIP